MKAFLLPLLSATLALAPTIGLAQTSKCDPADDSCKYYQVTYKLSSEGPIFGNLTVNSRRLKGWRWRTPSKIYDDYERVISEFCTLKLLKPSKVEREFSNIIHSLNKKD